MPTVFISYTGEALDYKAPLLKSLRAVDKAATDVCRYFDKNVKKVTTYLGWEQEYFLVDEGMLLARPDLLLTGRTLMGHDSAKNQQLEDHYFGSIPKRVAAFMKELEIEAMKLGIPAKTCHNEAAPNQFELAPIYEECNLAVDHNMLIMALMKEVARRHGFRVLLHEKPFKGVNGSGKSTMLKVISGILKPYKGSVTVNGSVAPLIELGAGFDQELTARENIFLNGCVLGHTEKFMKEHFDEIVDFAGLHDFLDSPIKNYSSGMSARLGFSIATMVKPDILIVDEILAVGDYKFRQKCEKRMAEMLNGGTTLLYVSHSIEEVKRLCDHAIWIDKGVTRMCGEVNEVCDAYMEVMRQ